MDGGETPASSGTSTSQVCHRACPLSLQGICLNGGEMSVDGAPVLGCQRATGTQVEPTQGESEKGLEAMLAQKL